MAASDIQLVNELMTLRRENRRLRYRQLDRADERAVAARERLIEQTYLDAQALLAAHFAWQETQRSQAPMSHRRWARAASFLKLARLAEHHRRYLTITAQQPEQAMARLTRARETALRDPGMLRAMIPKSRRPKALG